MPVLGIDPGRQGSMVLLDTQGVIEQHVMPTIGKVLDERAISEIIRKMYAKHIGLHVYLEEVHAIFGSSAKATFSFGDTCGFLRGVVTAFGIPYSKVQPKTWQAKMFEGIPKQWKVGKVKRVDTKRMALLASKRLFPDFNNLATERCTKPHDGLIDALLIAEFGRRDRQ